MKSIAGSIVTLSGAMILTFRKYHDDAIMLIAVVTMIVGAVVILKDVQESKDSKE
jgi:hypothetical protein